MRGKIIQHDVNLPRPFGLADQFRQKGNEIGAGMAFRRLAFDLSGLHVQRRIQRQRAVTIVFEPMPLGSARRQRQDRSSRSSA